jgi:hypothetical protein
LPDGPARLELSVLRSPREKKEKPIWDLRTTVQTTENHDVVGSQRWIKTRQSW